MTKNKTVLTSVVAIILFVVIVMVFLDRSGQPQQVAGVNLDGFASCIDNTGAVFYGAYWCSHCNTQKKLFGESAKLIPYVECSTPDGKQQTQVCRDAGITSYPTWEFADGESVKGRVPLATLAEYTGCELPADS